MSHKWIFVDTTLQQLYLYDGNDLLKQYPIATGKKGLGEIKGSEKTPRGWHLIEQKIGDEEPIYTVFISRVPTGEIYSDQLADQFPTRDWILTRILWLGGLEEGKNKGGDVDTFSRYIYIHGCPDSVVFGQPSSHGCIRMHNEDMISLFNAVNEKTPVYIGEVPPNNFKELIS